VSEVTVFERALDRSVERLVRACEVITICVGAWLAIALIAGVFFRYVLNSSLIWVDESSGMLIVWLMLAVAPIGFHQNFHISVTLVIEAVPRPMRVLLGIAVNACTVLLFGIAGYYGIFNTIIEMGSELSSMPFARAWFTWVLPVGSAAVLLVCLNNVVKILRRGDLLERGASLE
jgi:TRAP-type C4-dicarboxylate transport system permease small subunit